MEIKWKEKEAERERGRLMSLIMEIFLVELFPQGMRWDVGFLCHRHKYVFRYLAMYTILIQF
jgi:hypothetical protein